MTHALHLAAALLVGAASVLAAQDLSTWAHTRTLTFNTTAGGANVAGTVKDFPLLVRLHKDEFDFTKALGSGSDLRFSRPDGTLLPYEIETWDAARQEAAIWVRVDSIKGNASDQHIRMHWGRAGVEGLSDGPAVFDSARGFAEVWHLGGSGSRKNSATGGQTAVPSNYDGDESVPGIGNSGLCDSLDGTATGDHLAIGDWHNTYTGGFTFSFWLNPSSVKKFSHILELGNGDGLDNVVIQRVNLTDDLAVQVYSGGTPGAGADAVGALQLNQWQHLAVAITGTRARIYRNGALVIEKTLPYPIDATRRAFNYIGKSSWAADEYYQGKIDEAWISRTERSVDWVKLAYANQKVGQNLFSWGTTASCPEAFAMPPDTTLDEGSALELIPVADCSHSYTWSLESGPGLPILDPQVKNLLVSLPRTAGDTTLVYRFAADFPGHTLSSSVKVHVKAAIPDPIFTLPDTLAWSGKDSLVVKPAVTNLAAVKASRDSALRYAWTLSGVAADSSWKDGALVVKSPMGAGTLTIGLCLDNGGPVACESVVVLVGEASAVRPLPGRAALRPAGPRHDARGRRLAPKAAVKSWAR